MAGETELLAAVDAGQKEMYSQGSETPPVTDTPPPATDAPPVTDASPTDTPPATDSKFDATEFAKQTFGTDNIEEVKTRYTGYETVVSEKQTLAQQLEELRKEVPASELERFYVNGLRKGIPADVLTKVQSLDLAKMSAEEKVKYDMAIQKPYLTKEQIDAQYKNKYTVNPDAIDADEDKLLKDADLADAAFQAEQRLKDWTNKAMNPEPAKAQEEQEKAILQQQETLKTTWKSVAPRINDAIKEVAKKLPVATFDSKAGEEPQVDLKYQVPADKQQQYVNMAMDAYVKAGLDATPENITGIMDYANRIMRANEAENIAVAYAKDAVSFILQDFKTRFNNTSIGRTESDNTSARAQTDVEKQVSELISKM